MNKPPPSPPTSTDRPPQKKAPGTYSLANMLKELEHDADDLSGGQLLDQAGISAIFRKESK